MNQEVVNYLLAYENMKIIQRKDMFNFSLDTVLLAHFCTINKDLDEKWYPLKDYHCMYVSEIEHVYTKEQKRTLITFVLIKTF